MNEDTAMSDAAMDDEKAPPETEGGTTHADWGAGNPLLRISSDEREERFEHALTDPLTTIGSATDNTIRLPDTAPVHATIVHDDRDEYVLTLHAPGEMNANPHSAGTYPGDASETLRTGAHFTAGPWRLVFAREEFADHGRPFGGRVGGELSDQPPQPARPDYASGEGPAEPVSAEAPRGWEVQDD